MLEGRVKKFGVATAVIAVTSSEFWCHGWLWSRRIINLMVAVMYMQSNVVYTDSSRLRFFIARLLSVDEELSEPELDDDVARAAR